MAFGGGGGRGGPLSEINVTPLVDVMLVLLIIFMVAAPMLTTGVDVNLPKAEAPHLQLDEETPLIVVTEDQKIHIGDEETTLDALRAWLATSEKVRGKKEVYVQADERVPYGAVVQVLAVVRQAGIEKMGLVTDPLARE